MKPYASLSLHALARLLVRGYQIFVSPWVGPTCRFVPSCSEFALEAIEIHGLLRGTGLAAGRLCRCHPLGGHGFDPVPPPSRLRERSAA